MIKIRQAKSSVEKDGPLLNPDKRAHIRACLAPSWVQINERVLACSVKPYLQNMQIYHLAESLELIYACTRFSERVWHSKTKQKTTQWDPPVRSGKITCGMWSGLFLYSWIDPVGRAFIIVMMRLTESKRKWVQFLKLQKLVHKLWNSLRCLCASDLITGVIYSLWLFNGLLVVLIVDCESDCSKHIDSS